MRKYSLIVVVLIISTNVTFSHRQHVHQRIDVEGYNLLKKWMANAEIPYMKDHIGGLTTDYNGDRPWQKGYITTGAWREDVEDVVYKISSENPPTISGAVLGFVTAVGDALGGSENNDGFVSSTHFWDADNGDNVATDMYGAIDFLTFPTTFQFTIPNAYQKLMMYAYPNQVWTLNYQNGYTRTISDFQLPNGNIVTFDWYATLGLTYANLIDLYKTGRAWIVGYYNLNGQWITSNIDSRLPCEVVLSQSWRDIFVWEILGRMSHLIQDVGSPAHANVDPHSDTDQYLRHDNFEEYFGDIIWTADIVYNQNPAMLDPYVSSNPLHFLMYTTQQQANHFASNGPHMKQNNNTFGGNSLPEELNYLNSLNIPNYGEPTSMKESISESEIINERDRLMPQIIRATAGLLYWFAKEADILPKPLTAVNVLGDNILYAEMTGHWYTTLTNGIAPFNYKWEMKFAGNELLASQKVQLSSIIKPNLPPSNYWIPTGTNSPYYSTTQNPNDLRDFYLRCTVTDNTNTTKTSNEFYVIVSPDPPPLGKEIASNNKVQSKLMEEKEINENSLGNYPNPFNPTTVIKYSLKEKDKITLIVYDMIGKEVVRLVDGIQNEGEHSVSFDGGNLPSGMYVYQLKGNSFTINKKMLLVK